MRLARIGCGIAFAFCLTVSGCAQDTSKPDIPFWDYTLSVDQRVDDLVPRLTLEEKVKQLLYNAPAIPRLGIPEYNWWNEGLHGVARAGRATVFPQAIGLAATWDPDLLHRVATVISDEARAKHHESLRRGQRGIYEGLTFWSPNINIFRDPRWGRGMETFGEDPYLTGVLGVEFVRGLQGDDSIYFKTIATPKHFAVHSGPEPERHVFNAVVDERDLRETYLPAFRTTVLNGHAQSVMCAYNRFRGDPCCGSSTLLTSILRKEWGFDGYVVSDCWAIQDIYATHRVVRTASEAASMAVTAGTDLNCGVSFDSLGVAVRSGLIREALIDTALKRLFRARIRLGMFDPPALVKYAATPISLNDSEPHRLLALEAARKSIVLLKNEGNLLPLPKTVRTIAVIGPNADEVESLLGNYCGSPSAPVTPYRGIQKLAAPGSRVIYARGCELAQSIPSLVRVPDSVLRAGSGPDTEVGLRADYFNSHSFDGQPHLTRSDVTIDFNWWEDAPVRGMRPDSFGVRWNGYILPPATGRYHLGAQALGNVRLSIGDSVVCEFTSEHSVAFRSGEVYLERGRTYPIRLEYRDRRPNAEIHLLWQVPRTDLREEAVEAARTADLSVLVLGLSRKLEGEELPISIPGFRGGDRTSLDLPAAQESLLKDVASMGKPVVLVLLNGSALAVNWAASHVPAILEAWYPGQAGGVAIAEVLFGDQNPSGRLPVTFYRGVSQLPPFTDYSMKGKTYRYFKGQPLFPFGYGLSYTRFRYSNPKAPASIKTGEVFEVTVDVTNTGDSDGDEVVQLYVDHRQMPIIAPLRSLQGFTRIYLRQGESKTVSFRLTPRNLSFIDDDFIRVQVPGTIALVMGGQQPEVAGLQDAASTATVRTTVNVIGNRREIGEREW